MFQLTKEEQEEFKEIFSLVDADRSGKISPKELGQLTKKLGLKYTDKQLEQIVREVDVNKKGEIDFEEFLSVMSRQFVPTYTSEDLKHAFKVFCSPNSNKIYLNILKKAITEYSTEKISQEKAKKLLSQLSPDSSGAIDFNGFVNLMTLN